MLLGLDGTETMEGMLPPNCGGEDEYLRDDTEDSHGQCSQSPLHLKLKEEEC